MYRLYVMLLFLLGSFAGFGQQSGEQGYEDVAKFPTGKKGERIQAFIDAYNANDPEAVARFVNEECAAPFQEMAPMSMHQQVFLNQYRQTGPMQFHSIRQYTPPREDQTVMIFPDQNFGTWRAITFRFTDSPEQLIEDVSFNMARTPSNVEPEPPLREQDLAKQAGALMDRLCQRDVFSGTVLIAKGDQVVYETACGQASKRFNVANNLDTRFNLGSMNKMFTATAIMQLVEAGKLNLEDPISKYVDTTWLATDVTERIKVHHLLNHTSGLGSYFNNTYWNGSRELYRQLEDYKPLVKGDEPNFTPGERFRYSNTGMLLLGVIVEQVSGQNYFDYIREHIYQPAGMTHTDSYEMDEPVDNLAIGYIPDPSSPYGWRNNLFKHVIKGGPAGGGYSTVRDLHRFARALQTGKLLSKASLEQMWTSKPDQHYGYGFGVETQNEAVGKVVGHSGGFPGLNGNLDIFLDKGYIIAVLSNYDRGASPVARELYTMIGRLEEVGE